MDRLTHVVIFTGDVAGMRRFYEERVGLEVREESPEWVSFDTAAATLGLRFASEPARRGVQLQFATDDIAARERDLSARGVAFDPPGITSLPWGRMASLADPEGNPIVLLERPHPHLAGAGPALSAAINCRDLEAQKRFYRDLLGLAATLESPWWVQLAAGEASLGLYPRAGAAGGEGHHVRPVTIGLSVMDLADWHAERSALGLAFVSPPTDRGFGRYADALDPDGHPVSFRESPAAEAEPETLEEQLAEPFEDDAAPARTAMRKPVLKRAKATSRVATRPQYRSAVARPKRRRVSKPVARVASPRGTGPAGTRQKPKRKHDPKRARTKPATGRLRKAERRTFKSQKQAIAGASKRKPVKRASRARPARRRAAARGRQAMSGRRGRAGRRP